MNCPSCGRALATGAKCIYCAQGTQVRKQYQLEVPIPKGTTKPTKKAFSVPWKTILVLFLLGGLSIAVYKNPEWQAKFRELIKF